VGGKETNSKEFQARMKRIEEEEEEWVVARRRRYSPIRAVRKEEKG
jgi:hypothetical protein